MITITSHKDTWRVHRLMAKKEIVTEKRKRREKDKQAKEMKDHKYNIYRQMN